MAHMDQARKSTLAAAARTALAKWPGVKWSLSVRNHSTIVMTIAASDVDFAAAATEASLQQSISEGHVDVNRHYIARDFTGSARDFLLAAIEALSTGNHDRSDIQSDYFDVGWYVDIQIGRWNKPYRFTGAAAIEAPAPFEPAEPAVVSQQIREALAAAGIEKDDASVYVTRHAGHTSATVYVTVKRCDVDLISEASRIASPFERIERDAAGNVIGDSNCWVDVRYAPEAAAAVEDGLVTRSRDVGAEMVATAPVRANNFLSPIELIGAEQHDVDSIAAAIGNLVAPVQAGTISIRDALERVARAGWNRGFGAGDRWARERR